MRLIRGLGALFALAGLLLGVPAVLVGLSRGLVPVELSWSAISDALLRPDDGSVLAGLVAAVAWAAWLVVAASVVSELVNLVSGHRVRIRLPGLATPQRWAAGLLVTVVAMVSAPQLSAAVPAPPSVSTDVRSDPSPTPARAGAGAPAVAVPALPPLGRPPADAIHVHVVQPGDDLWSLAEKFYGRGRDWRKIAAANPDRLTGGPDRLVAGWRLRIPDAARTVPDGTATVRVRTGDTLSAIAGRVYDDPSRWPVLFDANRFQIADPDDLPVGVELVVPTRREADDGPSRKADLAEDRPTDESGQAAQDHRDEDDAETPTRPPVDDPSASAPPSADGPVPEQQAEAPPPPVEADSPAAAPGDDSALLAAGLAGVGGLLAAGLLGGLALRRRVQLQQRPVGRRLLPPAVPAQHAEASLGRRQRPVSLRTLDLATRAIAAHCHHTGAPLPVLRLACVAEDQLELRWSGPPPVAPVGFQVRGSNWVLRPDAVPYLRSVPGIGEAARPFPALVSLGTDEEGRQLVADLEAIGLLSLDADSPAVAEAALAAMAVELSFSPWADEMILTLVGTCERLPQALGKHNIMRTDDLDGLLDRLERRADVQRAHQAHSNLGQHRVDPDLADPWAPEILLINGELGADHRRRLELLIKAEPRVTIAAVVAGRLPSASWRMQLTDPTGASGAPPSGTIQPLGLTLVPQLLRPPAADVVVDLVAVTGSEETTPAPWWADGDPGPPPDNVTHLGRRFGGWAVHDLDTEGRAAVLAGNGVSAGAGGSPPHPILKLLGPIELEGAGGDYPPRAGKQCLEYCGWLLEHPGTTAHAMAVALAVAEGTRRSNMSRLRSWLGSDPNGEPYLPDAYTGRIVLHPGVSSDWHRLQILTAVGVNRTSTAGLCAALELVRGAPLADAAPGQWHWAEELRTDMISAIRDIGVALTDRALADNDIDLARWAAARGLVAAPGDELLTVARIRTEHQVGNPAEVERLTLQLAAQARNLGVDLHPDTVILLQEVMEGRVRARMA